MARFDEMFGDDSSGSVKKEDEDNGKNSGSGGPTGEVKQAEPKQESPDKGAKSVEVEGQAKGQSEQVAAPVATPAPTPGPSSEDRVAQAFATERRKYQERQDAAERRIAEMAEALKALQAPKTPEAKAPSFDEDPAGHLRWQQEQAIKRLDETEKLTRQQQQAYEQQRQQEQLRQVLGFKQAEFAAQNPDYSDAFLHWRKAEMTKLGYHPEQVIDGAFAELGYHPGSATKEQKIAVLQQHFELGEAARMLNMGVNPAEMIYNMARDVYGYRKAEAPKLADAPTTQAATTSAAEKVALIQQGLAESGSLGGGAASTAGAGSGDELTESFGAMRNFARKVNK